MNCTRCENTGFLNIERLPPEILEIHPDKFLDAATAWIATNPGCDVSICDCCGDGEEWYGVPGQHYGPDDPRGAHGPYAKNGGLCQCH